MPIKAILFDLDGVLVDMPDGHYEALNRALALFGAQIGREEHESFFNGLPTVKKLEKLEDMRRLPSGLREFINSIKQKYTKEIIPKYCTPDYSKIIMLKHLKKIAPFIPIFKDNIVLGRTACLGSDILRLRRKKGEKIISINQQKVRVDLFLEWLNGKPRPRSREIKKYFRDIAVYEHLKQQEQLPWLKIKKIKYLVMDSYSELTDKKFTSIKDGWSFCCHFSDLYLTDEFKNNFKIEGALPLEKLEESYRAFFSWFENAFPNKKVFFIHYPSLFDARSEYKERGAAILSVMQKIAGEKPYIKNIFLAETEITEKIKNDPFPYHYNKEIYQKLLKKWDDNR